MSDNDFAPRPWLPEAEYYRAAGPNGVIDVRDVIEAFGLNYNRGVILKYVARAGRKPGNDALLDLYKARVHLDREIARMTGAPGPLSGGRSTLDAAVAQAIAAFAALSPEAQEAELRAQRESFARGQLGMGNDADEAADRAALARGDPI